MGSRSFYLHLVVPYFVSSYWKQEINSWEHSHNIRSSMSCSKDNPPPERFSKANCTLGEGDNCQIDSRGIDSLDLLIRQIRKIIWINLRLIRKIDNRNDKHPCLGNVIDFLEVLLQFTYIFASWGGVYRCQWLVIKSIVKKSQHFKHRISKRVHFLHKKLIAT